MFFKGNSKTFRRYCLECNVVCIIVSYGLVSMLSN